MARVVVYTAHGCHLCGPAVETVRAVCGSDFAVVDITTDTELERQYRVRIPVVEVDGVERFRYHVDGDELRKFV
jgi:glutaredoxin-related protein